MSQTAIMTKGGSRKRTPRPSGGRQVSYQKSAVGFSTPAILLVAVLLYLPFIWTTVISFTDYNGLGSPSWVGFSNFIQMFKDPGLLTSSLNTVFWVVGTITIPVGLGLLVAVLTNGMKHGSWFRLPFLIPYAISGVAVGVVWQFVLQPDGALSQALTFLHLPGADTRWLTDAPVNTIVMILAAAWQATGVNALLFVIGLQSIPKEPLEAAKVDGAEGWRLFRYHLWPMLRPLTTVVVGLAIVGSLKTFDIVWVMTQGGPGRNSETLAVTMYRESLVQSNYGLGSAIALLLSLVTFAASIGYLRRQLSDSNSF